MIFGRYMAHAPEVPYPHSRHEKKNLTSFLIDFLREKKYVYVLMNKIGRIACVFYPDVKM